MKQARIFKSWLPPERAALAGDAIVLISIGVLVYIGVHFAHRSPMVVQGPTISLSPAALPGYAAYSLARVSFAYILSLVFTLIYGYFAAYNKRAEKVLLPLLDVLQSVPILAFLPVVLLSLSALLPKSLAAELAAIILVFTSQAWNMTFAWYQSLTTVPKDLIEASSIFSFNWWLRFRKLELPFAAISLIWNSMMSFAGGWFFLMAAEIFRVGDRDYRLPGLGSYLQEAANKGNLPAIFWGVGVLVFIIVALDQLLWRPLLAWAERFKLEMVEGENPATSWFYDLLRASSIKAWLDVQVIKPFLEYLDTVALRMFPASPVSEPSKKNTNPGMYVIGAAFGGVLIWGLAKALHLLLELTFGDVSAIAIGIGATFLRVAAALILALAWTIPVGVAIGTNKKLAAWLQPLVQISASIPATALFPILLVPMLRLPQGLNMAAVILMLMGTQWYLLFNVIAGASAIPQDLKYTSSLIGLTRWQRWRTLILPALFPFIVTGSITASGGAWNASIVAEYASFSGVVHRTVGAGALIANATATANYPLLLGSTLAMILTVVLINRLFWRRVYRLAEEQYRMD